ncbi:signal peptidase I [Candidatus Dojkabacteria bacterium]|nr:signal peptidase I [Candidatus Dojkabacteria bacterium]
MRINDKKEIVFNLITIASICILIFVALSTFNPFNFKIYTVLSGSMEPTITQGSIIIVSPKAQYLVGDIITFYTSKDRFSDNMKVDTVTHRIISINKISNNEVFLTKGDANASNDKEQISRSNIVGRVVFEIPSIGYVINFSKTLPGFSILIAMPLIYVIFAEVKNLKKEIDTLKNKKNLQIN